MNFYEKYIKRNFCAFFFSVERSYASLQDVEEETSIQLLVLKSVSGTQFLTFPTKTPGGMARRHVIPIGAAEKRAPVRELSSEFEYEKSYMLWARPTRRPTVPCSPAAAATPSRKRQNLAVPCRQQREETRFWFAGSIGTSFVTSSAVNSHARTLARWGSAFSLLLLPPPPPPPPL